AQNDISDIITQWKNKNLRHPELRPELVEGRSEGSEKIRLAAEPKTKYSKGRSDPSVVVSDFRESRDGVERLPQDDGRGRAGKCFLVPADEIRTNKYDLSISRYKEIEHTEIKYEKPGVIMQKVMRLEKEIENDIEAIKEMIG
ncbi:SAM-dependent DNA methyltransferase, partial [bacterium]